MTDSLISDFINHYNELNRKITENYLNTHHHNNNDKNKQNMITKFKNIRKQIDQLTYEIEDLIVEIDQGLFKLTDSEQQRIDDSFIRDRAIDNIKPLLLLSLMYESGKFDHHPEDIPD